MGSIYGKQFDEDVKTLVETEARHKEVRKRDAYNPHNDNPTADMKTRDVYDFNPDLREMGYTPKINRNSVKRAR